MVIAAECWAVESDDLPGKVAADLSHARAAEDRWWSDKFVAEIVPMVRALSKQPNLGTTYAERRAGELARVGRGRA